ncbi:MAG: histidine kinase [Bacteroidales bacterium]|nr:histidine kinase [Bacteroidales bacterium]
MNENSKSTLLNFISKHKSGGLWVALFIILFSGGLHVDWLISLISASISVLSMLILDRIVRCILIKELLRNHRQFFYYLIGFITITITVYLEVKFEIFIFKSLYEKNLIKIPELKNNVGLIYPVFKISLLLLATFTISTVSYFLTKSKETTTALENEKLDMELRYLKAQINPHFLFNALNNIYSLVYTNDENAPESILKLSEMLRYVTDECQIDKISIDKEINYIDNFIDFQLMRMEVHPNITFKKDIKNADFILPPMILQPFIENSFKHSRLESNKEGYINIEICQNEKEFYFMAENSQSPCTFHKQTERSGIGIINVKKRLDLAYRKNYTLNIENNSQFYRVELRIKL